MTLSKERTFYPILQFRRRALFTAVVPEGNFTEARLLARGRAIPGCNPPRPRQRRSPPPRPLSPTQMQTGESSRNLVKFYVIINFFMLFPRSPVGAVVRVYMEISH